MNIEIKQIASDLWEVYDLDKPTEDKSVGSAPTEEEAEQIASAYEGEQIKQDG